MREVFVTAAFAAPLGGWELLLAPALGWLVQNGLTWRAGREAEWSLRHMAGVLGAVPVGMVVLALQDAVMSRASQRDVAYLRLPLRLQRTLQLLFNGVLCSAADVSAYLLQPLQPPCNLTPPPPSPPAGDELLHPSHSRTAHTPLPRLGLVALPSRPQRRLALAVMPP
jgi:hypothetical protein